MLVVSFIPKSCHRLLSVSYYCEGLHLTCEQVTSEGVRWLFSQNTLFFPSLTTG